MEETTAIEKTMAEESSTRRPRSFMRRLHYWWSLFLAGALLGVLGPPILLVAWIVNKHDLVYPWARFGAGLWLRFSGVRVEVKGRRADTVRLRRREWRATPKIRRGSSCQPLRRCSS